MYLLEEVGGIDLMAVMVQKKLRAYAWNPSNKTMGIDAGGKLTLYGAFVVNVPKNCFYPIPKVDSLVVHLL